jgi:hypothetical protein
MMHTLLTALVLLVLAAPASAIVEKRSGSSSGGGGSAESDSFYFATTVNDPTVTAETTGVFICRKGQLTMSVSSQACNFPVDVTITHFSVSALQSLNDDEEEGETSLVVGGVRDESSTILFGRDKASTGCDFFFNNAGGTDVRRLGDSCTKVVDIDIDAGVLFYIGLFNGTTPLTVLEQLTFHIRGLIR